MTKNSAASMVHGLRFSLVGIVTVLMVCLCVNPVLAFAGDSIEPAGSGTSMAKRAAQADPHCVLLTKEGRLVPCTSAGVMTGALWGEEDYDAIDHATKLFIAADVTKIPETAYWDFVGGGGGSSCPWTVGEYFDGQDRRCSCLSSIVFLTKNGKNACKDVSGLCFFPESTYYKRAGIRVINFEKTCVTSLGNTFSDSQITSIKLPNNLKKLNAYAFSGCARLKKLNLQNTKLSSFSLQAVEYCGISSIVLPPTCKKVTGTAWLGKKLKVYLTRKGTVSVQGEGKLKRSKIKSMGPGSVSRSLKISWKRVHSVSAPSTCGYEIWISKNKKFGKGTIKTTFKKGKIPYKKCTYTGLIKKKGARYYAKVRPYIKSWDNVVYYGAWSKVKSGKSKK